MTAPTTELAATTATWRRNEWMVCASIMALWLGATAWIRPLAIPDEGRYVGVSWEMLRSGNWAVPTLDGMPFFHKPPLFYWITAGSMRVFGDNVAAARLAPWLAAVVTATGLFMFVKRWVGAARARTSVVVLATLPLFYGGAQYANLDMLVATLIASAILLVAIARRLDGSLLFTSEPEVSLTFQPTPGKSTQEVNNAQWHVFTVVQSDRVIQVAQPTAARREGAVEAASRLVIPLAALIALIGAVLPGALRRGMKPLAFANDALALRNARSLAPLDLQGVPIEIMPVVRTLNDLLRRLESAFATQRHFVADAAHELRSPVTALQLQAQILEGSRDPNERSLATSELTIGIGRMRRLIEQLLYLSRASADENGESVFASENVDLADLTRQVVVRWIPEAERRGIDLGAGSLDAVSIEGNASQLEIMLSNLVENALRYTPRGGVVDVFAARLDGAPALRVVDNGPGIESAERERVFDRFYRSPEAVASEESGSGLGLAIVRSIADRHSAIVSLHDAPGGRGLEVRVVFKASA